jgi:glutathione S-transferase
MKVTFYYLSGSPFSWKVWLALEHKGLPYELKILKADAGDLRKPEYLAISPYGKAPAIEVDGFALYESSAIIEFLEDSFPDHGSPLWPRELQQRASARRLAAEVDAYLYPPVRRCVEQLLLRKEGLPDESILAQAREAIISSLAMFEAAIQGPFLMGARAGAADFALYPMTAMLVRIELRHPERGFSALMSERLQEWRSRVEEMPIFQKTLPPHWRT